MLKGLQHYRIIITLLSSTGNSLTNKKLLVSALAKKLFILIHIYLNVRDDFCSTFLGTAKISAKLKKWIFFVLSSIVEPSIKRKCNLKSYCVSI